MVAPWWWRLGSSAREGEVGRVKASCPSPAPHRCLSALPVRRNTQEPDSTLSSPLAPGPTSLGPCTTSDLVFRDSSLVPPRPSTLGHRPTLHLRSWSRVPRDFRQPPLGVWRRRTFSPTGPRGHRSCQPAETGPSLGSQSPGGPLRGRRGRRGIRALMPQGCRTWPSPSTLQTVHLFTGTGTRGALHSFDFRWLLFPPRGILHGASAHAKFSYRTDSSLPWRLWESGT